MKKNRLISFGCSLTQGAALDDNWDNDKQERLSNTSVYAWPQLVANELNLECINTATGGASGKEIWHNIINFDFQENDIVFVQWPDVNRYAKFSLVGNEVKVDTMGVWRSTSDTLSTLFFKYFYSDYDMKMDLLLRMNYVDTLFKTKNITNYQFMIDDRMFGKLYSKHLLNVKLLDVKFKQNRIDLANDAIHPGPLSHRMISDRILNCIANEIYYNV